jgi:hypothetical protein
MPIQVLKTVKNPTRWAVKNQRGLYLEKALTDKTSQLFTVASNCHESPILYSTKVMAKEVARMLNDTSTRGEIWSIEGR